MKKLRNWKVIWYGQDWPHRRYVLGQRPASLAWKLYWLAKGRGLQPELWKGKGRVL